MRTNLILMLVAAWLLTSCRSTQDMIYLQNTGSYAGENHATTKPTKYRLQPDDNLYVKVISLDNNINMMFTNQAGSMNTSSLNEMGLFINSYTVNKDGVVRIPVLGDLKVQGLTVDETQKLFSKRCDKFLKDAVVTVKLTSFRYSVMGEVYRPGTYLSTKGNINIFEALSMGGDLKDYANRTEVKVIRTVEGGKKIYTVDMTSDKILTSDVFYLQSNDIVYVRQDRYKNIMLNATTYNMFLSTISSILLILNFTK